jgi:Trk-type K+ transport system membrane component
MQFNAHFLFIRVFDPVLDPVSQAIVIGLNSFPKAGLSVFTESLILILV